jgi:hypothetical protein
VSIKIDSVDYIAEDAADILKDPLTLELRTIAHASGWPSRLISAMEINYEDGDLVINWPEELNEDIDNLEYGDINSLPNSAIRPFLLRAPSTITKVIERQSLGQLFMALGVV